ncbi:Zinc finger protein [Armadillidium nasatum]|uniref:Zinc finger protein n=1 Tax=Armadillidium nasatum TaxID=96803 RepID=A0A5N5SW22_9CRUS|nr:Zinc finger protein [Armadillidium nasatum]
MKMHGQTIVINDLLSFLTCKINTVPKETLLSVINEYYPKNVISEAHKVLLSSLPLKKSTKHGRRVKHPDVLSTIYDCIDLIPKEDLPVFVCKDLNKVPSVSQENSSVGRRLTLQKDIRSDDRNVKRDESFYRKEQMQMRRQITHMFTIISEITEGMQKLSEQDVSLDSEKGKTNNDTRFFSTSTLKSESSFSNNYEMENEDDDLSDEDGDSIVDFDEGLQGLALIQKFIDEDDEKSKIELEEKDDESITFEDDFDNVEIDDDIESFDAYNFKGKSHRSNNFHFPNAEAEIETSEVTYDPVVYIKEEDREFPPEMENCIEITAEQDYLDPLDESSVDSSVRGSYAADKEEHMESKSLTHDSLEESPKKKGSNYECHYCLEMFSAYKKFRKHMNTHCVVKSSYRCVLCPTKFASRDELRKHFTACFDMNKDLYKDNMCLICKTYYASDKALKQHNNLHEDFRPHACPHCPFRYLNKDRLDAHVKNQHSPLKTLICPFCPHSAITNAYLSKHIKVHTGEAPFLCKTCGHKSKTKFQLKRHMELHGPLKERKCDKCNFVCLGLNHYLRHRRMQHGQPIVCQICNESFKQSDAFVRHFTLHTNNKPYKCDQCQYRATVKETLRLHKLTHSASNTEICAKCNVPCKNKRNLTRHMMLYCNNLDKAN